MRRIFEMYLRQYINTLQRDDNNNDDGSDEEYIDDEEEDYIEEDDDEEEIITNYINNRITSRRPRQDEERENHFHEQIKEKLQVLKTHDLSQTILSHSGKFCCQPSDSNNNATSSSLIPNNNIQEEQESFNPEETNDFRNEYKHFYCGVNYNNDNSLVHLLHKRMIGANHPGSLHRNNCISSKGCTTKIASRYLPERNVGPIDNAYAQVFCGQFTVDGKYFMSASQDQVVRIYDVNTILFKKNSSMDGNESINEDSMIDEDDDEQSIVNTVKPIREIQARDVGWSIIDSHTSSDNKYLIYSSWSPYIHLATCVPEDYDPNELMEKRVKYIEKHEQLNLNPGNYRFCAFSVRFSPNGKEILAGANDSCLYIYDIEKNQRIEKITAHNDDINTVSYIDEFSSNVFCSGSDDGFCKIWDRRQFSTKKNKSIGTLVGHTDGITCISSKGDGRYFISNGKDQTLKLWDIRKMKNAGEDVPQIPKTNSFWDYRYENCPSRHSRVVHPNDMSLMTYTGHKVLQTLIRCYFSPQSTGQQYIVTGSQDGIVYIYDIITAKIVKRLYGHTAVVRDVSWHPHLPVLFSSSWDGNCLMFAHSNSV